MPKLWAKSLGERGHRVRIYEARPGVCRAYPDGLRCGYYEFLMFEREQQGDDTFVATT